VRLAGFCAYCGSMFQHTSYWDVKTKLFFGKRVQILLDIVFTGEKKNLFELCSRMIEFWLTFRSRMIKNSA
jgi:hypothetical protein